MARQNVRSYYSRSPFFCFPFGSFDEVERERHGCGGVRFEQQVAGIQNVSFHPRLFELRLGERLRLIALGRGPE